MSPSEIKSNSRPVEAQQDNLGVSTIMQDSLSADIVHDSKKLKERITDLLKGDTEFSKMKQGDKALVVGTASGLFTAVLPLLAVGATLAIPGAIVGLTLFFAAKVAIKAVQSGYKGLKWSAEKTVEGAKHIGGKIKDGAMHVKDKVEGGYEYSVDSLKRGASFVSEGAANKLHKAAGKEDYLDKIKRFTKEEKEKSYKIRDDLKEIFADKENNSGLIKDILSGISSKIDSKIKEKTELGQIDQTFERLLKQGKFISGLSKESLHSLLTQRSLPKDTYLIDSIFSEHHDEIKEVIVKCKADHILKGSLKMRNNMFKEGDNNKPRSFSLKRSNSEQSNSLSGSSSTSSISTTSSKAELLNLSEHKEVKAPTSLWSKLSSSLKGGKKPDLTRYERISEDERPSIDVSSMPSRPNSMDSISNDSTATVSHFATIKAKRSKSSTPAASPTVPTKSSPCSSSVDSGMDSSNSSTPREQSLPIEESERRLDEAMKELDIVASQLPSSKVTAEAKAELQASKTNERQ